MKRTILPILSLLLAVNVIALPEMAQPKQQDGKAKQSKAAVAKSSATADAKRHQRANKLSSPEYLEAVKSYADGHYAEAMREFQALDRSGMCCDMVHYYMALCCQRTNQMQPAIENYRYVVAYSKDERLRSYAFGAASQLGHYQANRTYQGNGNFFQGQRTGQSRPGGAGGGGGGC